MKMKQAKDNQNIDPAIHNFSIKLGITKHNFRPLMLQLE